MKYRPIFITATNTDIGKSYATIKLIEELGRQGLKVGVLKPIETGVIDGQPLDGKILLEAVQKINPNFKEFTCNDIVPVQYELPAAPYVSKGDSPLDLEAISRAYEKILSVSDIVIIEGAGGLMVPIEKNLYMYNLIEAFDAITLLVTRSSLGCINDTLLNLAFLDSLGVEYEWCVNMRENRESFEEITLPYYKDVMSRVLILQDDLKLLSEDLLKLNK